MKKGIAGFTLLMMMTMFSAIVWAGNGVERGSIFSWGSETQELDALKKAKVEEALRTSCPGLLAGQSAKNPVQIVSAKADRTQDPEEKSRTRHQRFLLETIPSYAHETTKHVQVLVPVDSSGESARVVGSDAHGMCDDLDKN